MAARTGEGSGVLLLRSHETECFRTLRFGYLFCSNGTFGVITTMGHQFFSLRSANSSSGTRRPPIPPFLPRKEDDPVLLSKKGPTNACTQLLPPLNIVMRHVLLGALY